MDFTTVLKTRGNPRTITSLSLFTTATTYVDALKIIQLPKLRPAPGHVLSA